MDKKNHNIWNFLKGAFKIFSIHFKGFYRFKPSLINWILSINILFFISINCLYFFSSPSYQSSSFQEAFLYILTKEGGLANDKNDKGGITKYGISIRYLKSLIEKNPFLIKRYDLNNNMKVDSYDIIHMNKNIAFEIYKTYWWDKYNYGRINYQPLANKLLDISVNMGPHYAAVFFGKACKELYCSKPLKINSKLNTLDIQCVNSLSEEKKIQIIKKLTKLSLEHYLDIVKKNPAEYKFLRGWRSRALYSGESKKGL